MFLATWATLLAGFALEPLIALGPLSAALLTAEVAPVAIIGIGLFAGYRLVRGAVRWAARSGTVQSLRLRVSVPPVAVLPWTARIRVE
jgi:hypothetical protein